MIKIFKNENKDEDENYLSIHLYHTNDEPKFLLSQLHLTNVSAYKITEDKSWWNQELRYQDTEMHMLLISLTNDVACKKIAKMTPDKKIEYEVISQKKDLVAELKINYSHNGKFDWKTTRYRSYTRVYVPLGSKLITSSGASDGEVKAYEDLGKTCFAVFISVEPGSAGALYFKYKLPPSFLNSEKYELYVQKQPGNNIKELSVLINLKKSISDYAPSSAVASGDSSVKWITDLRVDRGFALTNF